MSYKFIPVMKAVDEYSAKGVDISCKPHKTWDTYEINYSGLKFLITSDFKMKSPWDLDWIHFDHRVDVVEYIVKTFPIEIKDNIKTYLLTDGKRYKIGCTKNIKNRLSSLRTANIDIELVCYGDNVSEKMMHGLFKEKRVDREWFELNEKDVNDVRSLMNGSTTLVEHLKNSYKHYKIPFGKHRHKFIHELMNAEDISYLEWVAESMFCTNSAGKMFIRCSKKAVREWKSKQKI